MPRPVSEAASRTHPMKIIVTKSENQLRLRLAGELCISQAQTAWDRFLQVAEAGSDLTVDFASLTEIDTAGIQLVLALRQEMVREDRKLHLVNPSPEVAEAFAFLGRGDLFRDFPPSGNASP